MLSHPVTDVIFKKETQEAILSCRHIKGLINDFMEELLDRDPTYEEIRALGRAGAQKKFLQSLWPIQVVHMMFCPACARHFYRYFNIIDEMANFNDFND